MINNPVILEMQKPEQHLINDFDRCRLGERSDRATAINMGPRFEGIAHGTFDKVD